MGTGYVSPFFRPGFLRFRRQPRSVSNFFMKSGLAQPRLIQAGRFVKDHSLEAYTRERAGAVTASSAGSPGC